MFATAILQRHPHVLLRRVEATTCQLLSTIRSRQHCQPIAASCARAFSDTVTERDLVHTKIDDELGIAEITMDNGAVNSLSLEM